MIDRFRKSGVPVLALLFTLGASGAHAEDFCLSAFSGTVTYAFNLQQVTPLSGPSAGPVTGRSFGAVAPCGTNGNIPLDGTLVLDGANQIVIGFMGHAVNPATGCGSIEYKVVLDLTTLAGTLSLHNARNNFDNTTGVTAIACPATSAKPKRRLAAGATDATGNRVPE